MKKNFSVDSPNQLRIVAILLPCFILLFSMFHSYAQTAPKFDHSIFDKLLKKYVNQDGRVDYVNFANDRKTLRQYLNSLGSNPPDTILWSREEQLAYWVNLYNAFTTELILDHYPLESIRDIGSKIPIVFGETAWDIEFIYIGDKTYTLDAIEHQVLKEKFNDPRTHFALVCAATSCPNLRREAYLPEKLESQFNSQAVLFLSNPSKNILNSKSIQISEIFNWYNDEFTKDGSLIDFLNQYTNLTIDQDAEISYIKFDWSLNGLN